MYPRIAVLSLALAGCFPIALVSTTHVGEQRTLVDTRTSSHQADIKGESCYVENEYKTTSTVYVMRGRANVRVWAVLEMVVFGAAAAGASPPDAYYMAIPAADGLLALAYTLLRDDSVSTSTDWQESNETAPCRK